jgi:hypothetical protein
MFAYAGIFKIADTQLFASQMKESPLIPQSIISSLSIGLPVFELILAFILTFDKYNSVSLTLSFITMLFFSLYLIMLVSLYEKVPCACGGILGKLGYTEHIIFNLFFLTISGISLYLHDSKSNTTHQENYI